MSDKLINLTIDFSSDKPVKITINMPKNEQKQELNPVLDISDTTTQITLEDAFALEAAKHATTHPVIAITQNGDITFGSMGNTILARFLELDKLIILNTPPKKLNHKKNHKYEPVTILDEQDTEIDTKVTTIITHISTLILKEQKIWWDIMFRYLFYVRNLRGEGKRERLFFHYLYEKIYHYYPKTLINLIIQIPKYGYFGDLNNMCIKYFEKGDTNITDAIVNCYIKFLNADSIQLFGKNIDSVSYEESKKLNDNLKTMTPEELYEFKKDKNISLAAKWIPRENKNNNKIRELIIDKLYSMPGNETLEKTNVKLFKQRTNFSSMRFRTIITVFSQCIGVGEQNMCTQPEKMGEIQRTWSDINFKNSPACFSTKYRKAFLNEKLSKKLTSEEVATGNRSKDPDRIQCRKNILESIINGANQDIAKLSEIIMKHLANLSNLTTGERILISKQWTDLVEKIKQDIIEANSDITRDGNFIDPQDVIPIVDTSGSMESNNVLSKSIGLGLLATAISNLPGCMISFSEEPTVYKIDLKQDIFEQFKTVLKSSRGLSTNIDKTTGVLLSLMEKSNTTKIYTVLILTDGEFDSPIVKFDFDYNSINTKNSDFFQNVYLGRMEKAFQEKGYNLPRIIFWNLVGTSSNYYATESIKGVQTLTGFSQGQMKQVFTGELDTIIDEETGLMRVNVDPGTSFLKVIRSEIFDSISDIVNETKENVFGMVI
jgi:hypothetical protein